jgi:uncharacterized protein YebE (UPF0316 family)
LFESLLFVIAFSGLLATLGSPWNLLAFGVGFGTGNWLGITLESRLAPGHTLLRITSARRPAAIADALRRAGHGATEVPGFGESGFLGLVISYVPRREVDRVRRLVLAVSPEAALTAENVRELRGGWRPAGRTRLRLHPQYYPDKIAGDAPADTQFGERVAAQV